MTVEFKFTLADRVLVREIQRPGVVAAARLDHFGKQVLVVWWNDGHRNEAWLYEWELEARASEVARE